MNVVRLGTPVAPPGLAVREVRILGDEERGYLVAGIADTEVEFWFDSLADAIAAAERLGATRDRWAALEVPPVTGSP